MVNIPRQPLFRRRSTFVVVKPIRLSVKDVLEPGTVLEPGKFPTHRTLSWYRRRRIGPKDSTWTNHMLEAFFAREKGDKLKTKKEPNEGPSDDQSKETPDDNSSDGGEDVLEITQEGNMFTITLNGEEQAKLKGKKKLNKWLETKGYNTV